VKGAKQQRSEALLDAAMRLRALIPQEKSEYVLACLSVIETHGPRRYRGREDWRGRGEGCLSRRSLRVGDITKGVRFPVSARFWVAEVNFRRVSQPSAVT
jgi:hypothetical protein